MLFPYIFMKGHLFTADRVFRSVSRVIYRPATPEGLYIYGDGEERSCSRLFSRASGGQTHHLPRTQAISAVCHTPVESM